MQWAINRRELIMNKEDELNLAKEMATLTAVIKSFGDKLDTIESDLKDNSKELHKIAASVKANARSLSLVWKIVILLLGGVGTVAGFLFTQR